MSLLGSEEKKESDKLLQAYKFLVRVATASVTTLSGTLATKNDSLTFNLWYSVVSIYFLLDDFFIWQNLVC